MRYRTGKVVIYKTETDRTEVRSFFFPDTYFDFKVSQVDENNPDVCMCKIKGVDRATYGSLKLKDISKYKERYYAEIYLGYSGVNNLIYKGSISRIIYAFNKGGQELKLILDDNTIKFTKDIKHISIASETFLLDALTAICNTFEYKLYIDAHVNTLQSIKRFAVTGSCKECIDSVINDTLDYNIKDHNIYIHKKGEVPKYHLYKNSQKSNVEAKTRNLVLHVNNGLLAYPDDDSKDNKYNLKAILIPDLAVGQIIKIPVDKDWYTDYDSGTYVEFEVVKFSSSFASGLAVTEMECNKIDR